MAHPKRKISKSRRNKRRTHYKAEAPSLTTCQTTGAIHLPHRAYMVEGNLYYNGKILVESAVVA